MVQVDFGICSCVLSISANDSCILQFSVLMNEMRVVLAVDWETRFFIASIHMISIVLCFSSPDLLSDVGQALVGFHFLGSILYAMDFNTEFVERFLS